MSKYVVVTVAGLGAAVWGMAANADAKAKFESDCAECHEAGDFAGEDAAAMADTLKKIAAGQQKHKAKITLSDADATAMAAFLAAGGK
jgi:mono/diheme cytochrome c family protein